jgi:hypothetical protein
LEASTKRDFSGTWEGTANNQPAITLFIQEDRGAISGEITFYTQTSGSDGIWRVADKFTTPITSPEVKESTLIFRAQYYKSRGSSDLGDFKYEMILDGLNASTFHGLGHRHRHKATPLRLTRQQ